MPTFQYEIINVEGVSSKGQLSGTNRDAIAEILKAEGAEVVSIAQIKTTKKKGGLLLGRKVLKGKKQTAFTQQLASLINAGIPLVRSLRTLQKQSEKADPLGEFVIRSIADDVEGGDYFSEALSKQTSSFSQFFISMIEAAEASGAMDLILSRLALFMERSEEVRRKVKSAMTYPMVILTVALVITYGLMVVIVPKITTMFDELTDGEAELPALTRAVVQVSDFLQANFVLIFISSIVGFFLTKFFVSTRGGKNILDKFLFILPVFGKIFKKVILARFCRNLSLLLETGVPIITSLGITDKSCDNAVVSGILSQMNTRVQEGENVSTILGEFKFFPIMMVSMVEVGEESGSMSTMLGKIADLYEGDVEAIIDGLASIIEPIMMVLISLVIGTIVIAMFLPMISLLQNLGA